MGEPTFQDVAYGDHERDVVDLYQADSEGLTPVYVYIHGGGFRGGDKAGISQVLLKGCLEAGISVAAINYPLSGTDRYPAAMEHSQRAIQFIRWKSEEWNLDASRVAAGGGSAGAGISMWIGFRGEEAEPESEDPVARQSTTSQRPERCLAADVRGVVAGAVFLRSAFYSYDYFGAGVCTRGATIIFWIFARFLMKNSTSQRPERCLKQLRRSIMCLKTRRP